MPIVDNFYNTTDNVIPPNNFLLETITLVSKSVFGSESVFVSVFVSGSNKFPDIKIVKFNLQLYIKIVKLH